MTRPLALQPAITYGPIFSRRLGRSLGINLLPVDRKVCSYDCIYCHYGRTALKTLDPDRTLLPSVDEVLDAVALALSGPAQFDYLTFSGNGEATLHPDFLEIARGSRLLRDRLRPEVRLALLSNASTVGRPEMREALSLIDDPILKLDAGDPETWAAINRPVSTLLEEHVVEGLKGLPGLVIQTVLIDGPVSNVRGQPYRAWLEALCEIKPARVQIYSTDRPVAESGVERVLPYVLEGIARQVGACAGTRADAYWAEA